MGTWINGVEQSDGGTMTAAQIRAALGTGLQLQEFHQNITTDDTITTAIPIDDTAPTPSEMTLYASQAITPGNASNIIEVAVSIWGEISSTNNSLFAAVFVDSETTPKALFESDYNHTTGLYASISRLCSFAAGTTSAITVKVYLGIRAAGTFYAAHESPRDYGNSLTNHIRVREIQA